MTRKQWKTKIKKACTNAGTYNKSFDAAIDTLAGILETRDKTQEKYEAEGGDPVVEHTNKAGATNIVKNPALQIIDNCNIQALAYFRDLGLTAKGLKSIGVDVEKKEESSFEKLFSDLGI